MTDELPTLCNPPHCRRIHGHPAPHVALPSEVWGFFAPNDKAKLTKAGFATPRGGRKGAYQNHVARNNRVIVPFERLGDVSLNLYLDGYVIRLLPHQYFEKRGEVKAEFRERDSKIRLGENAFVLYRTHESLEEFPPLDGWKVCSLEGPSGPVNIRARTVVDNGEYVLRLSRKGALPQRVEGPPQGLFATEYADATTNFMCKSVLAWLIVQTVSSPYTMTQAVHLRAVLREAGLDDIAAYERTGVVRHGLAGCPLCLRLIRYEDLHETVSFDETAGLENAADQVEGSTRSTVVNLFHLQPLAYHSLVHVAGNIAWGHAICNTRLGQRRCYSLQELIDEDRKIGIIHEAGIETFGWISRDDQMIRSPNGAVWIQLNGDVAEGPPAQAGTFDEAVVEAEQEGEESPQDDVDWS